MLVLPMHSSNPRMETSPLMVPVRDLSLHPKTASVWVHDAARHRRLLNRTFASENGIDERRLGVWKAIY